YDCEQDLLYQDGSSQLSFHYRLGDDPGFDWTRSWRSIRAGHKQEGRLLAFRAESLDLSGIIRRRYFRLEFRSHHGPHARRQALDSQRNLAVETFFLICIDTDLGDFTGHQVHLLLGDMNLADVRNLLA